MSDVDLEALRNQMLSDLNRYNIHLLREQGAKIGVKSVTTYKKERLVDLIIEKKLASQQSYRPDLSFQNTFSLSPKEREWIMELSSSADDVEGEVVSGILELTDGIDGFLRVDERKKSPKDIFVAQSVINEYELRFGDHVIAKVVPLKQSQVKAAVSIMSINGNKNRKKLVRAEFAEMSCQPASLMIPLFDKKSDSALPQELKNTLRMIDLFSPIAMGQSNLILSSVPLDMTSLISSTIRAFKNSGIKTSVMCLFEKGPMITALKDEFGSMVQSTGCEATLKDNERFAQLSLESAKRNAELGKDTALIITNIASLFPIGYKQSAESDHSLRTLFASARQLRNGGSLTIVAFSHLIGELGETIYETLVPSANSVGVLGRRQGTLRKLKFDIERSFTDFYDYNPQEAQRINNIITYIEEHDELLTDEQILEIEA